MIGFSFKWVASAGYDIITMGSYAFKLLTWLYNTLLMTTCHDYFVFYFIVFLSDC